jgi:hypothetical protein
MTMAEIGQGELAAQAASLAGVGVAYRTLTISRSRVISLDADSRTIAVPPDDRKLSVTSRSARRIGDARRKGR